MKSKGTRKRTTVSVAPAIKVLAKDLMARRGYTFSGLIAQLIREECDRRGIKDPDVSASKTGKHEHTVSEDVDQQRRAKRSKP